MKVINATEDKLIINNIKLDVNSNNIFHLLHINRVEVIDADGRSYVNWHKDNAVQISFQNFGNTLKIFISGKQGYSNE